MMLDASRPFRTVLFALVAFAYLVLLAPLCVIAVSSLGATSYLAFPPQGLTVRWYLEVLNSEPYRQSLGLSVVVAVGATAASSVLGALAAVALARYRFSGRDVVNALILSPLILPPLVLAIALSLFFSAIGVGPSIERLMLAHVVLCVPYVVRVLLPVLQRFDRDLEHAAQDLGATPLAAFFLVTLPIVRRGLIAGAVFAFIISFDEVVLGVFLAPVAQPTLPVQMYGAVQYLLHPTVAAVSTLLIALTAVLMLGAEAALGLRGSGTRRGG